MDGRGGAPASCTAPPDPCQNKHGAPILAKSGTGSDPAPPIVPCLASVGGSDAHLEVRGADPLSSPRMDSRVPGTQFIKGKEKEVGFPTP